MIGTVHCDTCGHDIDDVRVQDYHLKACGKCADSPLISDADKAVADLHDFLESLGLCKALTKAEAAKPHDGLHLTINTAGLRREPGR